MPVYEFSVEMSCTGCSGTVERVLRKLGDMVENVSIDLEGNKVYITSNLPADELLEILRKTGKDTSYLGLSD